MSNIEEGRTTLPTETIDGERPEKDGELYYCRSCGALITSGSERAEIDGGYTHTFVNPAGYVFRIACFHSASGCSVAGAATSDFTWFAGRAWALAICTSCSVHLGWAYFREARLEFYGLILDQLRRGGE